MNNISLKQANDNDSSEIIMNMMNNEAGIKDVFAGKMDRLMSSQISLLIQQDNQNIGFVNLVTERCNYDYLFVDMGIIEKYRGQGIGKQVLTMISQLDTEEYILGETRTDNTLANGSVNGIGCYLATFGDRNIYLLQKDKLEKFIDENHLEKLDKHFTIHSKRDLIK